jgi:hypothetical protein
MHHLGWLGLASILLVAACGHTSTPAAEPTEPAPLSLGKATDPRFMYAVVGGEVRAGPRMAGPDGRPIFKRAHHPPIVIARIEPPFSRGAQVIVDPRTGNLVPYRIPVAGIAQAPVDDLPRRLTLLVPDPAAQLDPAPRTQDEFLALDDSTLTTYLTSWLAYRESHEHRASLSPRELDVLLASYAFVLVPDDGFAALVASRDLSATRDALRRVGLEAHAAVLDHAIDKSASTATLDQEWRAITERSRPRIAEYVRAHPSDFAWSRMVY